MRHALFLSLLVASLLLPGCSLLYPRLSAENDSLRAENMALRQDVDALKGERSQAAQRTAALEGERGTERARAEAAEQALSEEKARVLPVPVPSPDEADMAKLRTDLTQSRQDVERLRLDNEKLSARVETLEGENEALKSEAAPPGPTAAERAKLDLRNAVSEALKDEIAYGNAILAENGEVAVSLLCEVLFQPNTTNLSDKGLAMLKALAATIPGAPIRQIRILGHTDSTPVNTRTYMDNWQLGADRGLAVARWFAVQPGDFASRIVAGSRGFAAPLADESTPSGRRKNRRVEIVFELEAAP